MKRILELVLRNRTGVVVSFALAAGLGLWAMGRIPVDAVPDITPVQVVVNTKTGALDPEQIEKAVSFLNETEMSGIANVREVRSLSKYGLSQVVVIFEDGTDIYWARQQVAERLQNVRGELPEGLSPELAPITTGLGEVLMYAVLAKPDSPLAKKPEKERLLYLRTVQDFVIAPFLKRSVRGVAEVDSTGGYKKEIHVDIHPDALGEHGLSIEDVAERLETLGENFGGGYIQPKGKQVVVRTAGRVRSLDDIRDLPVQLDVFGKPIPLSRVADVREDYAQRGGGGTFNGEETVLGMVLMLSGANSRKVALDAERALEEIPFPPDVQVKLLYSRSFLVNATLRTVMTNMAEGAALVVAVLLLLLGNLRAALFVSLAIPLSMLFGAIGMRWFGVSASLMSLGAIDFGLLVDGAVVMIENASRRLEEHRGPLDPERRFSLILEAAAEVVKPVTLGQLIIMLVYVPIFSLEGIEGKLYHPMAITVLAALGASLLVAVLLMPVLAYLYLKAPQSGVKEGTWAFRAVRRLYEPVLQICLRHRTSTLAPAVALMVLALVVYRRMGADFMPPLDEGDLVVNLTRSSDIGVDASLDMQKKSDHVIMGFQEVEEVFSRIGTPESATDPMGVHLSDTFVILKKERSRWPRAEHGRPRTKGELYEAIKEALARDVPDQAINENQPIEMRFAEILEGSRADVTLRIYGKDLPALMDLLVKAIELIEPIRGVEEVEMDALTALRKSPVLSARLNHGAIARYGLDVQRVNRLLEAAMGGREVGSFYEYQWRFPIVLRVAEEHRENVEAIRALPVGLPGGGTIPLSKVTDFEYQEEVTTVSHDFTQRYAAVAIFLSGRDIASFIEEARRVIGERLELPEGYTIRWGGQFNNLERARRRLALIVPVTLGGILLVLWQAFRSFRQALLVFACIPLAMTGGVFALALRGIPLSVSASVGFIALMGIAVLNGIVLLTFFNQLRARGFGPLDAVKEGSLVRLRPVVMTALVASLGFLPMALNTGIGAEVQRPLATVVIGGLITATFLTLLVLPTLYAWVEGKAESAR